MSVKLHVDLETLQLVQGPGLRSAVAALRFKRGDAARIQVIFLENGISPVPIGDPDELEIQIGIKPRNQFDHSYLAHSAVWSMPAEGDDTPTYECELSFNTLQLNSALNVGSATAEELPEITLMGEITWREGDGEPTSTRTFLVVVENDVNRGTEGAPSDANPVNITLTGTIAASNLSGTNTGDQDLSGLAPIAHTHVVADIVSVASQRLIGRHTSGNGAAQEVGVGNGLEFQGGGIRRSALTGDVTASAGSNDTTIADDAVSNAKLADMPTATIKGRTTAGTGDPEDLTAAEALALIGAATPASVSAQIAAGFVLGSGAEIELPNGSKIQVGTTDAGLGGLGGISLVCSIGYHYQWDAGALFVRGQDGFTIREVRYWRSGVPDATLDVTKGYASGSRLIMENGDVYECNDPSANSAIWQPVGFTTAGGSAYFPMGINVAEGQILQVDTIYDANSPLNYISIVEGKLGAYNSYHYPSVDWMNRQLIGTDGTMAMLDWSDLGTVKFNYANLSSVNSCYAAGFYGGTIESPSYAYFPYGIAITDLYSDRIYKSAGGSLYIDLATSSLNDSGTKNVDWANKVLNTGMGSDNIPSVDWNSRCLIASDGQTVALDWSSGEMRFGYDGSGSSYSVASLFDGTGGLVLSATYAYNANDGFQVPVEVMVGNDTEIVHELLIGNPNNRFFDQQGNANYANSAGIADSASNAYSASYTPNGNYLGSLFDASGGYVLSALSAVSADHLTGYQMTGHTLVNCYALGGLSLDPGTQLNFYGATARFDRDGDDNVSKADFTSGAQANFTSGAVANFYTGGSSFYGNGGSAAFGSGSTTGFSDGSTLTLNGLVIEGVSSRSGAGAVPLTHPVCRLTSTGSAQAITLANGTAGQKLTIYHGVDGGSMVLTATTKTGWTTSITFTNVGDNVVLQYFATVGWLVLSSRGATVS
jgi:hypothetical protein